MKKKLRTLFVRLQNKNVIVALVSGITLLLTSSGVIDVTHANHINNIVNISLTILVSLGIISDPESHVEDSVELENHNV